jgi:hypothetical protein
MKLRMAEILPSPLSLLVATLSVWVGTRALQLLGQRWPVFLFGGLIPPSS